MVCIGKSRMSSRRYRDRHPTTWSGMVGNKTVFGALKRIRTSDLLITYQMHFTNPNKIEQF